MPILLGKGAFRIGGLGQAPAVPPAKPTGLVAYGGQGGAYASWSPSAGANNYDVQGSNDGSSWSDVEVALAAVNCSDTTGYTYYRVRAHNAAGTSAYTSAATSQPPTSNTEIWLRSVHGFTASTWSDQSGNGNDATQATAGNQFSKQNNVINGQPAIRSADANRIMDLPSVQPTTGSFTKIVLFKLSDTTGSNNLLTGDSSAGSAVFQANSGSLVVGRVDGASLTANVIPSPQTAWALAMVTVFHSVNPNTGADTWQEAIYLNNSLVAFSPAFQTTHPGGVTLSVGGVQGVPGFGIVGDQLEVMLIGGIPTAAELNNLAKMVNATYRLSIPTFSKQVPFIGDSITTGAVASTGSWANQVALATPSVYYINKGRSGAFTSDLISDQLTNLYPYTSCGVPTTCVVWSGTNDVDFGGFTAAQTYSNIRSLCQNLRSNGASKVIVVSMLPRDGDETKRQQLNSALRADHSFADEFADVETLAMGAAGENDLTTYYDADKIHPNQTGHDALYGLIGPLI